MAYLSLPDSQRKAQPDRLCLGHEDEPVALFLFGHGKVATIQNSSISLSRSSPSRTADTLKHEFTAYLDDPWGWVRFCRGGSYPPKGDHYANSLRTPGESEILVE